jgi:hypothetical protein
MARLGSCRQTRISERREERGQVKKQSHNFHKQSTR